MARPERFELPTLCSGGTRSIQLSYGRIVLILHSLPQLNNVAGSNAGSKFSRDIRDHSQRSGIVSGCKMQVQTHDFLAPVSVSHPNIVKRHAVSDTIRNAVMPKRVHSESGQTETAHGLLLTSTSRTPP